MDSNDKYKIRSRYFSSTISERFPNGDLVARGKISASKWCNFCNFSENLVFSRDNRGGPAPISVTFDRPEIGLRSYFLSAIRD